MMRENVHRIVLVLVFLSLFTVADADYLPLVGKRISVSDGLLCNAVNEMAQDNSGYIWMGTTNGLCRYDGYGSVNFNTLSSIPNMKPDTHVGRLYMDSKNNLLWIRTATFLNACYDLTKGCFVDYTGCGDHFRKMNNTFLSSEGMWLYSQTFGVRYIRYVNGHFVRRDYTKSNNLLTTNHVTSLLEDSRQNIWISTDHGIILVYRDGSSRIVDRQHPIISAATYGDFIYFISVDNRVFVYNSMGQEKASYVMPSAVGRIGIVNACFGWQGWLMIFTPTDTYSMNVQTGKFYHPQAYQIQNAVPQNPIDGYHFLSNNSGSFWIFPEKGSMTSLKLIDNARYTTNKIHKFSVVTDKDGLLYIATYGNGLFIYDSRNGHLRHFTAEDKTPLIFSNYLICAMMDKSDNLWVGSDVAGASCISPIKGAIARYVLPEPSHVGDWANSIIYTEQTSSRSVTVATKENKIYQYDPLSGKIRFIRELPACVRAISTDAEGRTWIGTYGAGLYVGRDHYTSSDKKFNLPSPRDQIYDICRDRRGRMWVATWGGGLLMGQVGKDGHVTFRQFLNRNINECVVHDLELGAGNDLWIATSNGLYLLNTDCMRVTNDSFHCFNIDNGKFPNDEIVSLFYDRNGKLWVCTPGKGVFKCDFNPLRTTVHWQSFTSRQGIINDNVQSVCEDVLGNKWVSTEEGVSVINEKNGNIFSYQFSPTLEGNHYAEKCALRLTDGRLLLGTHQGLAVVSFIKDRQREHQLPAYVTDLWINGTSLYENSNEMDDIKEFLTSKKEISLAHNQNSISIFFSNFDYAHIRSALYEYYLEGVDKTWRRLTSVNHADYSSLPPGHYRFHLRSSANGKVSVLDIIIRQPWYNSWWAWLIYLALASICLILLYRNWREKFRLHQQMKLEQQLMEFRLNFFTHITHEFRTPLAIIQGAVDKISQSDGHTSKSAIQTALRGTKRLLRLVNQFMEFRKINTDNIHLAVERGDIISFVHHIYLDFRDIAQQKDINMTFTPFTKSYELYFDRQMVETMVYNVLSNAIKYSPMRGHVSFKMSLSSDGKRLLIFCEDDGPGISAKQEESLFKPFMHGYVSQGGMGIGLYTAYRMAQYHHGFLSYKRVSDSGGSLFTIDLPADDVSYGTSDYKAVAAIDMSSVESRSEKVIHEMTPKAFNDVTVVVIEDDLDMMSQIKGELSIYFNVICYLDGKSGYEGIVQNHPALVVCDVMLPDMNGYDIVKKVRKDGTSFDIPILMLTALDDDSHQIKAYEAGADDYMVKPCNFRVLIARATQLIEWNRRIGVSVVSADVDAAPSVNKGGKGEVLIKTQADRRFIDTVNVCMAQHLSEPDFNVDQLASMLNMGRTKFYGKMRELTGMSPNKFLSEERLRKAAELLLDGDLNVAEVSYKVGYQDTSYFNKCFKTRYGVVPSKYGREK